MNFLADRKLKKMINEDLSSYGFSIGEPQSDHVKGKVFLTLIRGLLVFLSTYGVIGGLCSSFGLAFDPVAVGAMLFVISVTIAFIYYNKFTFYTGYVMLFLAFLVLYVTAYAYINSGFQAFLNEVYSSYGDFFLLPSTRETTEYIADRSVTVPAAMLFTGAGFAILLNISISAYMDPFTTFLVTFLPLQIAFYIDIIPPLPYLVMLITVYITVTVLGSSGSFKLPYRYKKGQQYLRKRSAKKDRYEYISSGTGMLQLSVIAAMGAAVLMLVMNTVFIGRFSTKYVSNGIKDRTDGYVKILAQGGISSLFNRYEAKGGLSHGRLGGISSVAPDYETDLVVRFVPTYTYSENNMHPVYLKAYTGVYYRDNRFGIIKPDGNGSFDSVHEDTYMPVGAEYMDTGNSAYIKMFILNKDADNTYDYRPYFSVYSGSGRNESAKGVSDGLSQNADRMMGLSGMVIEDEEPLKDWAGGYLTENEHATAYEMIYTPHTYGEHFEPDPDITDEYERYVYENYLDLPDELSQVLSDIVLETGIGDDGLLSDDISLKRQERLKKAAAVKQYFRDNFQYSMLPGASPLNKDAIGYFLTEQKRGFCVHFASSGALILRAAGVPTRYVEGYVINPGDVTESSIERVNADDWVISDKTGKGDRIAVSDVEIPDANAHAWLEIYFDGYGWIPYEMTPPDEDEDLSYIGFADFFARLFAPTQRNVKGFGSISIAEAAANADKNTGRLGRMFGSVGYLITPLLVMLGLTGAVILSLYSLSCVKKTVRLGRLIKAGDYDGALLLKYRDTVDALRKRGLLNKACPSVKDVRDVFAVYVPEGSMDHEVFESVQKAAFSKAGTDDQTYIMAARKLKELLICLEKQLKINRK